MEFTLPEHAAYTTKQDLVYQALRQAIMCCELQPGQRLLLQEVAEELSVSTIPVREALRRLASEGLVEHRPHVGVIVAPISEDSVVEIFAVKEGLETVATRIVATKANKESVLRLAQLVEEMDESLAGCKYEHWAPLNTTLHKAIADMTEMPVLKDMTAQILDRWDRLRIYFFKDVLLHRIREAQREHHKLIEAIQRRDSQRAEQIVREHNRNALKAYTEYLSKIDQ